MNTSKHTTYGTFDWVPAQFRYLINKPEARYEIRQKFYKKYGKGKGLFWQLFEKLLALVSNREWFGRSELAFMRWEIDRGVLNPLEGHKPPGSPWWSNVNLFFIVTSETAADYYESKKDVDHLSQEVKLWVDYLNDRSTKSWYRAHNATIVQAYIKFIDLAREEEKYEKLFMNEVLYRLLFAQALEEDYTDFKELGALLATPLSPAVDIMVHIPEFYPDHYPLWPEDIQNILHKDKSLLGTLEADFDNYIIYPHLTALFKAAAKWLQMPELENFIADGNAIYPNLSTIKS